MRLVTQRYTADRATLNGNYDGGRGPGRGGGRGQGGRGGSAAAPTPPSSADPSPVSMSANRIARLKRFDMNWQAALGRLDTNRLSAAAKTDLEELKKTVQTNLAQLDTDAAAMAEVAPLVPFAPSSCSLNERRIKLEDVNAQQAAAS